MAHRLGVQEVEASIETLRNYIDWTPFFMTWSLAGKYPRILEDEVVGVEAQRLFKDANDMLDKLSAEKTLNPRGVVGLFPANRVGDDIEIYRDETRTHVINVPLRTIVRCTGSLTGSATSASTASHIDTPRSAARWAIRSTVVSPMPRTG